MPSGPAVGEVAEEPQARGPGGPVARGVEEALLLERGDQLVEVAVHVAHDVQRTRPVGGLGGRHRGGVHDDLHRFAPVDDGQVAPGGRVALGAPPPTPAASPGAALGGYGPVSWMYAGTRKSRATSPSAPPRVPDRPPESSTPPPPSRRICTGSDCLVAAARGVVGPS